MPRHAMLWVVSVLAVVSLTFADFYSYEGHTVLRTYPSSLDHVRLLQELVENHSELDIWHAGIETGTDIQVPPELQYEFIQNLTKVNIKHHHMIADLDTFLARQGYSSGPIPERQEVDFNKYNRLSTILSWLDTLHTGDKVIVENIGKSYLSKDLKVIKIGNTVNDPNSNTPIFWIDGTIHAREWISPAVVIYIIDKLIKDVQSGGSLTKKFDWHILPVMNPDGYEFSHVSQRLWRKSRSVNSGSNCMGTDINRNFDYKWGTVGISRNPCSNTYCGSKAFSEPEARVVRDYVIPRQSNIKVFLTTHSYGQLWLTPWGYTKELPEDYDEIFRVGKAANDALIAVSGQNYRVGSAANILYQSSGTSRDWAKGVPKVPYVYTLELRDRGTYGFLLPPTFIEPTSTEVWAAVQVMAREARI